MMWIIVFIIFIVFIVPGLVIAILMVVTEREKPLKTKSRELVNAFQEVINVPTLPKSIEDFHTSLSVRAFRVLGGISAYLSINGSLIDYSYMIILPITVYGAMFLFYMTFISFTRLALLTKNWIQGKYSAHNSPIKAGSHVLKNNYSSVKYICLLIIVGVIVLGGIYFDPTFVMRLMQSAKLQSVLAKIGTYLDFEMVKIMLENSLGIEALIGIGLGTFLVYVLGVLIFTEREKTFNTKVKDFAKSLKSGYDVPSLPKWLSDFNASKGVRLFRYIGVPCTFLTLRGLLDGYSPYLKLPVSTISWIVMSYAVFLAVNGFIGVVKAWWQGKYEKRNSPIKYVPHTGQNAVAVGKGVLWVVTGLSAGAITAQGLDNTLVNSGFPRYFHPTFVEPVVKTSLGALGIHPNNETLEALKLNKKSDHCLKMAQSYKDKIELLANSEHGKGGYAGSKEYMCKLKTSRIYWESELIKSRRALLEMENNRNDNVD